MKLTIDNNDYTGAMDAENPPRVWRRLNQSTEMRVSLIATDPAFVVPAANARVMLTRSNGNSVFTGYVSAAPAHEYLGWGERGPGYRYTVRALSDESQLSSKLLPPRSEFVDRSAGDILQTVANDAIPGALDIAECEDVSALPSYWPDPRLRFDEHAAALGARARASYRAQDGRLFFRPVGAVTHVLDESSPEFSPEKLKLESAGDPANDVTVVGQVGPAAFVKDYFYGNGYTMSFPLSEFPYTRAGAVIVDEEYRGAALRPEYWTVQDPNGAVAVSAGKLRASGGAGALGATLVSFVEQLELAGALTFDHGEMEITGPADAIVGGLYDGSFELAGCLAGFRLTPSSGAATQIAAVVNGTVAGQTITAAAGRKYVLSTRIYAGEPYRFEQRFETCSGGVGGGEIATGARFLLEVHEIDPNNPASLITPATVLYEGVLPDVPACCDYALINAASLNASVSYTRVARVADAEVRTCSLFGSWRNRIVGALSEGCECRIDGTSLYFFPASAPENGERILVTYRAAARTVSRVLDEAAIAEQASATDDGHRAVVTRVASPLPRTPDDADNAAIALLRSQQPPWRGEYETWDSFLPGNFYPGDAIEVQAPRRGAEFRAIVREVEIEATDLLDDRCRVRLKFATESADPIGLCLEPAPELRVPEATSTVLTVGTEYLAAVKNAEIIDAGSTEVMIDAGADPPASGGFEVRRSDSGWGLEDDRNLVGRFDYRIFNLPRTSRSQTWYLRQHDGSGRYSRVSTILHLDYPL